ncbi:MAG TPA: aminopeptidase, partial [Euryarchaeota archaeon]|nr:aminopeptidase [Euryarchaeota archaeon]
DPKKLAMMSVSRREITQLFHKRTGEGKLRWVGLPFPTDAMAQEANMSFSEYERFVYGACKVDKRDPVKEWEKVKREQDKMVKLLDKVNRLEFFGKDTELKMSVKGRKWINCCGDKNMPDGEVFTGPVENSVEGKIRFTYPGIYMGNEIEDIRLEFKKGKVIKARAAKGQKLLEQLLAIDDGCRRLGEVAIGTNYGIKKFSKNMLFDEKIGGTIHMALGMGFPETRSKNQAPIHWDILKDMKKGEVLADNKTVYKNGKWVA